MDEKEQLLTVQQSKVGNSVIVIKASPNNQVVN